MSAIHVYIPAPSEAYKQATLSLVHRMSELTFGSLLAAYCLGFVGAMPLIGPNSHNMDFGASCWLPNTHRFP
jgi:hypothetical protein